MKKEFNEILETYLLDKSKKTNKDSRIHNLIINILPEQIKNSIVFHRDNYHVGGSYGQGNKSEYPWIMVSNKEITKSAQKGLYLVYLFRSDMKGFYLSLNQGITFYKNNFGKNSLAYAKKVADFFRDLIADDNFKEEIDLVSMNNPLAKGYESCNIVAKYYKFDNLDERVISQDLNKFIELYKQIQDQWIFKTYDEVVSNVISDHLEPTKEGHVALKALLAASEKNTDGIVVTFDLEKVEPPTARNKDKEKNIIKVMSVSKKDYPKIQKENAETGNFGERKVFEYEQKLLKELNINKPVKWVALKDDTKGFDILSYEIENGKIVEKFIEVKTTKGSKYSHFYISKNELEKFKNNSNYVIYRVFEANRTKDKARFYEIRDIDESVYDIQPENYVIKIK
jgi:hypothetical protein